MIHETLSSPRVLRGAPATVYLDVYDGSREATVSAPAPTVAIVDQSGTAVASGTATIETSPKNRISYTFTPTESAVLTATWTGVKVGSDTLTLTSTHEVVGDLLFTLNEVRANKDLAQAGTYSDAAILRERDNIWDRFESILGYALGGRVRTATLNGSGYEDLWLSSDTETIRSIETRSSGVWTAFTSDELEDVIVAPGGRVSRETLGYWPSGRQNIRVVAELGKVPIHSALKQAALLVLRDQIVPSNIPARAVSQNSEAGNYTYAVAGRGSASGIQHYGIPLVDAVLNEMAANLPGFA